MTLLSSGCVVITGAGGGLGCRIVREFINAGFKNLACQYRSSAEKLETIFRDHGLDPKRHMFQAELTSEFEVKRFREDVKERLGTTWGLVNLAGGSSNGLSWKLSVEEFMSVVSSNLLSTFISTREFIPEMRLLGGGRIINVSSVVAHSGIAGASHYCAAKAGIEGFTRAVARELANKSVTVNCIALGYFDDGLIRDVPPELREGIVGSIPVKRLGMTEEIFPLVRYLLDESSGFMTGQVLHLNGGQYL
jgi:3-oxoacyl-[acyl-carrier protein] reductase